MEDWQGQQQQDEAQRVQRAIAILDASGRRALSEEERIEIAVEVGIAAMYRKQLNRTERK